jgi:hypothetical protein
MVFGASALGRQTGSRSSCAAEPRFRLGWGETLEERPRLAVA